MKLTPDEIATILDNQLNSYNCDNLSKAVVSKMTHTHRTLQALFVKFFISCIVGYYQAYFRNFQNPTLQDIETYSDLRNIAALKVARLIYELYASNKLNIPFI
jgi:hypothetical protein